MKSIFKTLTKIILLAILFSSVKEYTVLAEDKINVQVNNSTTIVKEEKYLREYRTSTPISLITAFVTAC